MLDDKCCGTCKYHHHENIDDGWVCVNDRSEYCVEWMVLCQDLVQIKMRSSAC